MLAISQGLVVTLTERVQGTSDENLFKVIFFIPFQVFFIFFQLSSKYLLKYLCSLCLIRVDYNLYGFYTSFEVQVFYHDLSF